MSPRYSNVTSSIRGYDYMICITQSQIHLFKRTQRTSKSAPKFLPESQDENMCQPLFIGSWVEPASWSPKHTSSGSIEYPIVTTGIPRKTYIKCSQIFKDSIRWDNSKGETQFITWEKRGRRNIRSNYNSKAHDTSRSYHLKNTRERSNT